MHTHPSIRIFRSQTVTGAGHFLFLFLVLEGPLSEDTHSLDPALDKSGGPPPDFFFLPLFTIFHISFHLTFPSFFFLHIGILVIVAMSPNLDPFLQVRPPYPELPSDALIAYPWLSQFHIVNHIIANCLPHALFIAFLPGRLYLLSSLLP